MAGINISTFRLPAELTDADWQRKKGTLGKMHSTGLGDALKKLEAAWKKVDVQKLDPAANPVKTTADLDKRVKDSRDHYKAAVDPLAREVDAVKTAAEEAARKLKGAIGGSTAAKAAEAVAKAAANFKLTCKSLDLEGAIAKVQGDIKRKNEQATANLLPSIAKWKSGSSAFLSKPSLESWEKNIKQQGRSVSNCVAQMAGYKEQFWSEFEKFKGFDSGTLKFDAKDPKVNDKMVKLVEEAKKQVAKIEAYKPA